MLNGGLSIILLGFALLRLVVKKKEKFFIRSCALFFLRFAMC